MNDNINQNVEMPKSKSKSKSKIFAVLILGIVLGLGIFGILYVRGTQDILETNQEEDSSVEEIKLTAREIKENAIIKAYKDYYKSHDLIQESNISSWDVKIAQEFDDYVILDNTYKCLDKTDRCVYVSQSANPASDATYTFNIFVFGKYENEEYNISSLDSTVVKPNEEKVTDTSYPEMLQNYMTSNGLIMESNLSTFKIIEINYLGYLEENPNEKYYSVYGTYTCLDDSSNCVYQEQVDDMVEGAYPLSVTMVLVDNQVNRLTGSVTGDFKK